MIQSTHKKNNILNFFWYVLLFLLAINFANRYYYFTYAAFAVFLLTPGRLLRSNKSLFLLFVLAFFWVIFSPLSTNSILAPLKPFSYMLCYIMGYSFLKNTVSNDREKSFYLIAGILSTGMFTHFFLNWIKNGNSLERNTVDIWSSTTRAATGQAALACLPMAVAVACIFSKSNTRLKLISLAVLLCIIGYNLVLAGRTLFFMLIILLIAALFHRLLVFKKGNFRTFLIFTVAVVSLILLYQNNTFGVKEFVEESAFYDRFFDQYSIGLEDDTRLAKKQYYLKNMLEHPFGGLNMRQKVDFAHDLYLDTYDEGSIFAFIAVVIYVISSVVRLVKCLRNKALSFDFRQMVFCIYLALNIEFFVEPILPGMPWLFAVYCIIDGYIARIVDSSITIPRHN